MNSHSQKESPEITTEETLSGNSKTQHAALKKIAILSFLLFGGIFSLAAQETSPPDDPMTPLYIVSALVFLVVILVMSVAIYLIRVLNVVVEISAKERAKKMGLTYVPPPSLFAKLTQRLNASVPVAQEQDIDLGHNFDGIRELDNHLPPWWKWLFIGTIVWAGVYVVVYHFSDTLPLPLEEYQNELTLAEQQKQRFLASQPRAVIDENTLQFTKDAAIIKNGQKVFTEHPCGTCHGNEGGGNTIGPNLTDQYWIHKGSIQDIFKTIKNGAVEKGMPAWGKAMSPSDIRDVTFYVMSLQGTNPPNAKAPQGELYKEEAAPVSDSTKVQASAL